MIGESKEHYGRSSGLFRLLEQAKETQQKPIYRVLGEER